MLTPIQYASADAFLHQAQSTLLENEPANSLILSICLRLRNYPERIKAAPFLFSIEDEHRRILLAAIMTPPHNLIVHCAGDCEAATLGLLADHLLEQQWAVPGVLGMLPTSEQFAALWARRTGCKFQVNRRERAFELRSVIPPLPLPGLLRPAGEADLPLLAEWTRAFSVEALQEELPPEEALEMTATRIEDGQLYVWDARGVVSMAAAARPTIHGITVNLVYTPPRQRGRGYASNCVAALSQRMLDEGYQFCTLFTDLANPISNHIYQQIGYRPIADFNEYHFGND